MAGSPPDIYALVQQLVSDDTAAREQARFVLVELDEMVVSFLIDLFYAGLSETAGLIVIELVAEIGGFEARSLLEDVVHLSSYGRESWRRAAHLGLARNGWT